MIGLYTVKFLFFKLYIYDILHVQICLIKIIGIHLNTLELHWARPWEHLAPANLFALLPKELMNEGKQQLHGKSFQAPYHECDMYHLSGYS